MSKIPKLHPMPKDHPILRPVNPEHLALACHVAFGVQLGKLANRNPGSAKIHIPHGDKISEVTFTDIMPNRVMLAVSKELRAVDPGDSDDTVQRHTAIMARLLAIRSLVSSPEFSREIKQRDDGSFYLNAPAVLALAQTPLDRWTGKYKRRAFTETLTSISVPSELHTLTVEIPTEMIEERDNEIDPEVHELASDKQ